MRIRSTDPETMRLVARGPCTVVAVGVDGEALSSPRSFVDDSEHRLQIMRSGVVDCLHLEAGGRRLIVSVASRAVVPGDLYPIMATRLTLRTCTGDTNDPPGGCRCTRTQDSFRDHRAGDTGPRFLGRYVTRRVGGHASPVEVVGFPRYPTRLEMLLALDLARDEYDPSSDTVSFGNSATTVRACRTCAEPVLHGPTLCETCAHLMAMSRTAPAGRDPRAQAAIDKLAAAHGFRDVLSGAELRLVDTAEPDVTHADLDSQAQHVHRLMERCMEIHALLVAESERRRRAAADGELPFVAVPDRRPPNLDKAEREFAARRQLLDRSPNYIRARMFEKKL